MPVNQSHRDFINEVGRAAAIYGPPAGVYPGTIVAVAIHESNWGASAPGGNLFGIKDTDGDPDQNLMTHEYVDGRRVTRRDDFEAHGSIENSVKSFVDFLTRNPRYARAGVFDASNPDGQLRALHAAGYATDPGWYNATSGYLGDVDANLDPSTSALAATGSASSGLVPQAPPSPPPRPDPRSGASAMLPDRGSTTDLGQTPTFDELGRSFGSGSSASQDVYGPPMAPSGVYGPPMAPDVANPWPLPPPVSPDVANPPPLPPPSVSHPTPSLLPEPGTYDDLARVFGLGRESRGVTRVDRIEHVQPDGTTRVQSTGAGSSALPARPRVVPSTRPDADTDIGSAPTYSQFRSSGLLPSRPAQATTNLGGPVSHSDLMSTFGLNQTNDLGGPVSFGDLQSTLGLLPAGYATSGLNTTDTGLVPRTSRPAPAPDPLAGLRRLSGPVTSNTDRSQKVRKGETVSARVGSSGGGSSRRAVTSEGKGVYHTADGTRVYRQYAP